MTILKLQTLFIDTILKLMRLQTLFIDSILTLLRLQTLFIYTILKLLRCIMKLPVKDPIGQPSYTGAPPQEALIRQSSYTSPSGTPP